MTIPDNIPPPPPRKRKFYAEDVEQWRYFLARGWSLRQLASEFGCSPATISLAVRGKYGATIPSRPADPGNSGL